MPAAEPHPRRRVASWRALTIAVVAIACMASAPGASAQLPPIGGSPEEPAEDPAESTTTTVIAPVETTTTTAAPVQATTTTAARSAPTTARPASTSTTTTQVVTRDDVAQDARTVAEDEPLETTSTARDLLVAGDGTSGADSTTTSSTTVVEVAAEDGLLDEQAQIWLIVVGLLVVALLIGVWTWRYWIRTRPAPPEQDPDRTSVFRRG